MTAFGSPHRSRRNPSTVSSPERESLTELRSGREKSGGGRPATSVAGIGSSDPTFHAVCARHDRASTRARRTLPRSADLVGPSLLSVRSADRGRRFALARARRRSRYEAFVGHRRGRPPRDPRGWFVGDRPRGARPAEPHRAPSRGVPRPLDRGVLGDLPFLFVPEPGTDLGSGRKAVEGIRPHPARGPRSTGRCGAERAGRRPLGVVGARVRPASRRPDRTGAGNGLRAAPAGKGDTVRGGRADRVRPPDRGADARRRIQHGVRGPRCVLERVVGEHGDPEIGRRSGDDLGRLGSGRGLGARSPGARVRRGRSGPVGSAQSHTAASSGEHEARRGARDPSYAPSPGTGTRRRVCQLSHPDPRSVDGDGMRGLSPSDVFRLHGPDHPSGRSRGMFSLHGPTKLGCTHDRRSPTGESSENASGVARASYHGSLPAIGRGSFYRSVAAQGAGLDPLHGLQT
jgi:hypothetical protein